MPKMVIALFKKYIDLLDEVYMNASLSKDLDGDMSLVRAGANTNEIIIPKLSMDGLADYSRNDGYVKGAVNLTMESVKFNYDRGRKFDVDAMDNEETAGLAFGKLSSEFIRTKVVPEMDAFRFATYASIPNISVVSETFADGKELLKRINAANTQMDEDQVPSENRILYITPTNYNKVYDLNTTESREALSAFTKIVKVPQTRFYTAIKLKDGKTVGDEAGHFEKAEGAKDINFMIIHKEAIMQYPKHTVNKVISPELNQESDGWLFFYRAYGLADAYENKVAGIYLSHKA
ncbi:MAG: hypothetical protein RR623_10090 [Bacilli bacterium]